MLKTFIIKILSFSLILSAISFVLFYLLIPQYYLQVFPFLIVFFVALTIGVHLVLTRAGKKEIRQFSTYFMGSITAKLFIYLIFIIIYVFTDRENAVPFLLTFLCLYILFTFFETYYLLGDLKKEQNQVS
ncbi:MAG: hypothetical protein P1P88_23675 [Bacteroidales bacterium]|nr:hypothetical protein [Bacteroidales bacterium]